MKPLNAFDVYPLFIVGFMMTLAFTMLPCTVFAQITKANTLTIDRVWTADENGTDKSVFAPKDAIRYVTLITNTYTHPVTMQRITFDSFGPTWPNDGGQNPAYRTIYDYEQLNINVPVGQTIYYSPWSIPNSAQPGSYGVRINIYWYSPEDGPYAFAITNGGLLFSIPGSLATSVTTFLSDGVTATSASANVANVVGPGGALLYKITVTNTSTSTNTGVVLTDLLPPEIFDIIGTAITDHGICTKTGSWPSTTITCRLGSLPSHGTATVSFIASILVRNPDGTPHPPNGITNEVSVTSDQQPTSITRSLVTTAVTPISDADYNAFVNTVTSCLGLVTTPGIAFLAGVANILRAGTDQPQLTAAVTLSEERILKMELNKISSDVGLGPNLVPEITNVGGCGIALYAGGYIR